MLLLVPVGEDLGEEPLRLLVLGGVLGFNWGGREGGEGRGGEQ